MIYLGSHHGFARRLGLSFAHAEVCDGVQINDVGLSHDDFEPTTIVGSIRVGVSERDDKLELQLVSVEETTKDRAHSPIRLL